MLRRDPVHQSPERARSRISKAWRKVPDSTPPGGIPGTGAEILPFFSRKIGLLGEQEVPIDYGAKLTGRIGRTEVGMLDVRTRDVPHVDANNLLVAGAPVA